MSSNTASDPVAHLLRTASDEQLVRELFPDVQRIAGSVIGFADSDLLLTAAHDALLNVVRYRATFDGRSRGSTWLYTLTVRAARRAAGRLSVGYAETQLFD